MGLEINRLRLLEGEFAGPCRTLRAEGHLESVARETHDQGLFDSVDLGAVTLIELAQILQSGSALFVHLEALEGSEVLELGQRVASGGQHVDSLLVQDAPERLHVGNRDRTVFVSPVVLWSLVFLAEFHVAEKLDSGFIFFVLFQ